jgi:predicted RNase H-like HicB family nuclease
MATFIAIVIRDGDAGYTASFPDFPSCAVAALTVEHVIAKAREALSMHIERLLEANQRFCIPTAADAIELGDAFCFSRLSMCRMIFAWRRSILPFRLFRWPGSTLSPDVTG